MNGITTDLDVPAARRRDCPACSGSWRQPGGSMRRLQFWLGLARVLLAELVLGAALVFADWMWVLPTAVRGLGLVAMVGLAVCPPAPAPRPVRVDAGRRRGRGPFPRAGSTAPHRGRVCRTRRRIPSRLARSAQGPGSRHRHRTSGLDFRKLIPWAAFERRAVALFFASASGSSLCS